MLRPSGEEATGPASESKRYHWWLFAFYLVALLIPFAAAALALRTKHDLVAVLAVLAAIFPLAHAGGVTRREDRLVVMRQLQVFLLALLTAVVASLVLWLVTGALGEDVTKESGLTRATGLADGATTELRVPRGSGLHDELSVTLSVEDGTGGHSPCISLGSLEFSGKDLRSSVTTAMDDTVSAVLPLQVVGPEVSVRIKVITARDCRLALEPEQVGYH